MQFPSLFNRLPSFPISSSRNMLSAAHVLAMDAKNLLDVIDSIRSRFPNLFNNQHASSDSRSNKSTPNNSATSSPSRKIKPQQQQQQPPLPPLNRIISPSLDQSENFYQNSSEENQYQNLSNFNLPGAAAAVQQSQSSIEASHAENVYANEQQQQRNVQGQEERRSSRPQVAAKPFNFNIVKVKSNFGNGTTTTSNSGGGVTNELKIIEDDLYLGGGGGEGSEGAATSTKGDVNCRSNGAESMKLPEPVACSIVQENIFKKNQSVLHK